MKYIAFLFFTFSIQFVLATPFSGYVSKNRGTYYYTPKTSKIPYKIVPLAYEVEENLQRLGKGDMISGEGSLDKVNKRISITSIDYVGLRRLLGPWSAKDSTVIFKDFSTMKYIPRAKSALSADSQFKGIKEYRYSISPSDANEWTLFMSDDKSTTFATMEFTNTKVLIKIFESESGKIVRTLKLERP